MDVVAAFLIQKNKVLLTRRPNHANHGGLWEFPGGKVKSNESQPDALCRELQEELKLSMTPEAFQFLGTLEDGDFRLHFYKADLRQAYLPQEHPACSWESPDRNSQKKLCKLDAKAWEMFRNRF